MLPGALTIPIGHCPCLLDRYAFRYRAKAGSNTDNGVVEFPLITGGSMLLTLVATRNDGCASFQIKRVPGVINLTICLTSG